MINVDTAILDILTVAGRFFDQGSEQVVVGIVQRRDAIFKAAGKREHVPIRGIHIGRPELAIEARFAGRGWFPQRT